MSASRIAPTPPRLSRWLLARVLPAGYRDQILGDLAEDYAHDRATGGRVRADLRYRRELFSWTLLALRREATIPHGIPGKTNGMSQFLHDLRYAIRSVRKAPAFSATVILLLGLGIGASVAMYTIIDGIFLRPLPYQDPASLVAIGTTFGPNHARLASSSYPNFVEWSDRNQTLEAIAGALPVGFVVVDDDGANKLTTAAATRGLFSLLGVAPALGRHFSTDEHRPGAAAVAIVSHRLWQQRWGGDQAVLGAMLRTADEAYTVIGVLPQGFLAPEALGVGETDVWVTAERLEDDLQERGMRVLGVIGRLAPEATIEQTRAEFAALAEVQAEQYPEDNAPGDHPFGAGVRTLHAETAGGLENAHLILIGAVSFLFLIACVNVANLQLARAAARQSEIGVRSALGASRGRILRQLVTESVVLGLLGGGLGLVAARLGVDGFIAAIPDRLPRTAEITVDGRVLLFAIVLSTLTGVACGLLPAARLSRRAGDLAAAGGRTTASRARTRIQAGLVAAEIGLALILLIGAGLMLNSLTRLMLVEPGFEPDGVLVTRADPGSAGGAPEEWQQYFTQLLDRARALPGVESAGLTTNLPLHRLNWRAGLTFEQGTSEGGVNSHTVSPGYFRTLAIPLLRGRRFVATDDARERQVMIVNQAFVDAFWPGQEPIGQRVEYRRPFAGETARASVIGVVANVRSGLATDARPEMFVSVLQNPWPNMKLVARGSGSRAGLERSLREVARATNPGVPVDWVRPLSDLVVATVARERFIAVLLSTFAAVALLLASGGVYGTLAYIVAQRRREVGVRMALGAAPRQIQRLVVRQAALWAATGIVVGVAGAILASRLLSSMLFDIGPTDLATYVAVIAVLAAVALAAAWIPARSATRVDPVSALRAE